MLKLLSLTIASLMIVTSSQAQCPQPNTTLTRHYHPSANGKQIIDTDPLPPEVASFLASIRKSLPTPNTPFNRWKNLPAPNSFDGTGPVPTHCWGGGCFISCCYGPYDCWSQCLCCGDNLN